MSEHQPQNDNLPATISEEDKKNELTTPDFTGWTHAKVLQLEQLCGQVPKLSWRKIGAIIGCSHEYARKAAKKLDLVKQTVASFVDNRADILAERQLAILNIGLTDEDIENMSPSDRAKWFNVLADKEGKERGKNQQPQGFMICVKELHLEIKKGDMSIKSPFPGTGHKEIVIEPEEEPDNVSEIAEKTTEGR